MLEKTPPSQLEQVQRTLFDRYLFDRDLDNQQAANLFGVHPITIGRWRKRFDDPERRVPPRRKVREIASLTAGVVGEIDWHRPAYPTGYAPTPPQAADEGEGQ